jgi:3-deoxy-7-phosphoheptulonate synthase
MIIMKSGATKEQIGNVIKEIKKHGNRADLSQGEFKTVIGVIGDEKKMPFDRYATMPGVKEILRIDTPYKLISREYAKHYRESNTGTKTVRVGKVEIGSKQQVIMAGPCAVESKKQLFTIAEGAKKAGAHILRGGIFKPRSSVHSFQGLGSIDKESAIQALKWLSEAGKEFDMPTVTEVRGEIHVDMVAEYADMLQIGARNMYDQDLLTAVARKKKPVLLKRHFGAGIEEFLSFAEYIAAEGNKDIVLCERGIVPIGKGREYTRYTLDLAAVPAIRKETFLPIIVDPSHGTGRADLIYNMSCAATAAGAHGLMIEVHYNPPEALVDARQAITPDELAVIIKACNAIAKTIKASTS